MSISNLLLIGVTFAAYKFGAYNERCPGEAWQHIRSGVFWTWKFLQL